MMKLLLTESEDGQHKDWHWFSGENVDERINAVAEAYAKRGDHVEIVETNLKVTNIEAK